MSNIKPPSLLLMGAPGTGKTWMLGTALAAGLEVFVLVTDPNGTDVLIDTARAHGADMSKLHWRTLSPSAPGWDVLKKQASTVSTSDYEAIQKIKSGVEKRFTQQYSTFLNICADFVDDAGESWGDVTEWGPNRLFVIDSLTGLNEIIMDQTIGYKPAAHQGEWGVAMNLERKLLLKLTADCKCFFACLSHTTKEINEVTGISSITLNALGRKNAEPIASMFSEVVLSKKKGRDFFWSTEELNTDTKQRGLPIGSSLSPDFGQLVGVYRRRVAETASPSTAAVPPTKTAPPSQAKG